MLEREDLKGKNPPTLQRIIPIRCPLIDKLFGGRCFKSRAAPVHRSNETGSECLMTAPCIVLQVRSWVTCPFMLPHRRCFSLHWGGEDVSRSAIPTSQNESIRVRTQPWSSPARSCSVPKLCAYKILCLDGPAAVRSLKIDSLGS